MAKKYKETDVLTESKKRVEYVFDNFTKIYISFSGGKDSSVLLHLTMQEAIKRNRVIGVLFVDMEAQYKETIKHIEEMIDLYESHIELYWVALPIALRNATSMHEPKWTCWEPGKDWVRQPHHKSITNQDHFKWFEYGMEFEELVPAFGEWYSKGELTACLVGIRSDESLNRFRTIVRQNKARFNNIGWTTQVSKHKTEYLFNAYPIYDWRTEDIWTYNGKYNIPYNKLYEYMHKAGVPISKQRICQPYGDDQKKGLWLYHLIEPETWAKVVARVSGANFGSLYAKDAGNILGNIKVTKPVDLSWEQFAGVLLSSLPDVSKAHFAQKIWVFIGWYKKRGYENGIPDEADPKEEASKRVPSWRRICKTLLKNDFWCKGLSFAQTKSYSYRKHKYQGNYNGLFRGYKGGLK